MEIIARARHLRIAPRKVRKIADLIRHRSAIQAKMQLMHLPHRSARPIVKLINSALHNAKSNFGIDNVVFYVKHITVDGGPVAKRFRPGAAGRINPYTKRTSHVTLVLDDKGLGKQKKMSTKIKTHVSDASLSSEDHKYVKEAKKTKFVRSGKKAFSLKSKTVPRKVFQRKAIGS